MAENYKFIPESSNLKKGTKLQYKGRTDVIIKTVSDETSECDIIFPDKSKVRAKNLDDIDIKVKQFFGDEIYKKKKDGTYHTKNGEKVLNPKGWDMVGMYKGEKFVSIHSAFSPVKTPFLEYLEKVAE